MHYGTIGQKWGVRNYQNKDGSLTPAGRERYYGSSAKREYGSAKDVGNTIKKGFSVVGKKVADGIKSKAHEINENRKENAAYRKSQREKQKQLDRQFKKTFDKDTRLMTNEQLKAYTERLVAEKQYLDALKNYKKSDNTFSPLIEKGKEKAFALIADAADKAIRKTLDEKYDLGLSGNNSKNNKNDKNDKNDKRSLIQIVKSAQKKGIENLNNNQYDEYQKARGKLYKEGILSKPDKNNTKNSLMDIYMDGWKKGGLAMTSQEIKEWKSAASELSKMGVDVKPLRLKPESYYAKKAQQTGKKKLEQRKHKKTEDDSLHHSEGLWC